MVRLLSTPYAARGQGSDCWSWKGLGHQPLPSPSGNLSREKGSDSLKGQDKQLFLAPLPPKRSLRNGLEEWYVAVWPVQRMEPPTSNINSVNKGLDKSRFP